jgi:hypothetical protein
MSKHLRFLFVALAVVVVAASSIYFYRNSTKSRIDQFPYSLPSRQLESFRGSAERGDCEAARQLAMYYLNGALELDTAIKWLRVAARCPNASTKQYLVETLIGGNPRSDENVALTSEINGLIAEIRETDPGRAKELQEQVRKWIVDHSSRK